MAEPVEFDCSILTGPPGWASCSLRVGERSVKIGPFSHALTDGLDDLVRATVSIACQGGRAETFSMDDEPEPRWQWLLKLARGPELDVVITRIDDVETMIATEVLRATCDPDDFGRAILSGLLRTMSNEPHDQLLKRWSHFPVRAVAALEAALAKPPDAAVI
ncbi:MAG TPA: hypothetical protein VGG29_04335 [Caulobacteraceae bacterium]|jgi:hypothetical protein